MPSRTTRQQLVRIRRRALPAVREAYERGDISASCAGQLLYLPPAQQSAELERRLSEARTREARHQLVATTIRGYLDGLRGKKVNLVELSEAIQKALS
jgi:hypothetical protein